MSDDAKHQIILPARHRVTEMIIEDFHVQNGHTGIQQTLAESRQYYWIVNRISTVRRVLQKCHVCRRLTGKIGEQLAAQLQEVRVSSDEHRLKCSCRTKYKSGEEESETDEALWLHIHLFDFLSKSQPLYTMNKYHIYLGQLRFLGTFGDGFR